MSGLFVSIGAGPSPGPPLRATAIWQAREQGCCGASSMSPCLRQALFFVLPGMVRLRLRVFRIEGTRGVIASCSCGRWRHASCRR